MLDQNPEHILSEDPLRPTDEALLFEKLSSTTEDFEMLRYIRMQMRVYLKEPEQDNEH